jgi:hypothetical protein
MEVCQQLLTLLLLYLLLQWLLHQLLLLLRSGHSNLQPRAKVKRVFIALDFLTCEQSTLNHQSQMKYF